MGFPYIGCGLGLRPTYYSDILNNSIDVDWFEIISENYMIPGGNPLAMLERVREKFPVVMHGVSLSIASTDPVNLDYLKELKSLANRIEPMWISDHLAWTGIDGVNLHDLLPIPYTQEALNHISEKIRIVQDYLERPILIENPSTYISAMESEMDEADFLNELCEREKCSLLLDVNNIYVSAFNHKFDAVKYLNKIKPANIVQMHIAGHTNYGTHIIDTHDQPVCDDVWALMKIASEKFPNASPMLERDDNFPPFVEIKLEFNKMRHTHLSVRDKK